MMNHQFIITISGETFKQIEIQDVLPGVIVDSAIRGNNLSLQMILLWLQRHEENHAKLENLKTGVRLSNVEFVVRERNV